MNRGLTGYYTPIASPGEPCKAFVPHPLPPSPPIQSDDEMDELREHASLALGRLDGLAAVLPDTSVFLYSYIRKEAVLSSQIEGTQSSLADLLLFENEAAPGVPLADVTEVSNYVAPVQHGLKRLKDMPVSLRLLRETHRVLLAKGRGATRPPANSAAHKTGSAAAVPATPASCPLRPTTSPTASARSRNSCTTTRSRRPC